MLAKASICRTLFVDKRFLDLSFCRQKLCRQKFDKKALFSSTEMQVIRHLRQALHPIKLVAECISSEGSTLLAAEGAMKSMLAHLQNLKQNPIASDLVSHLKEEITINE